MAKTHTAQISPARGPWVLYVVLLNAPGVPWPEYEFAPGETVPTLAERSRALNALGYVFTDGTEWRWNEVTVTPGDPTSAVRLFASIEVEEASG
ncbi:DUF6303 family protein [Streptomyces sp. WMMB 322]|uniref:DUF6303 family protein n=1 Tax=Streptomyces sp. WMMB 322 TaxID=1286821 RepID=UPI0006E39742|nr:DUF6303 family protein [Streptomyces sp. WMMB 322]SCK47210.1 hypothetical protein H180DRAFT_04210 [Streptomyces sp. WMMB 322]